MGSQRGIIMLTVAPEIADRADWIAETFEVSQSQVAESAIAMLSNMLAQRDERAMRYMQAVHDETHKSWEANMKPIYAGVSP